MPHSFGYRAHTRDLFKKPFRGNGTIGQNRYLRPYYLGQIVDVVGDGGVHKVLYFDIYLASPLDSWCNATFV
jgi:large subunit ribosomal protein L21e